MESIEIVGTPAIMSSRRAGYGLRTRYVKQHLGELGQCLGLGVGRSKLQDV